jgi:hypothetical protein
MCHSTNSEVTFDPGIKERKYHHSIDVQSFTLSYSIHGQAHVSMACETKSSLWLWYHHLWDAFLLSWSPWSWKKCSCFIHIISNCFEKHSFWVFQKLLLLYRASIVIGESTSYYYFNEKCLCTTSQTKYSVTRNCTMLFPFLNDLLDGQKTSILCCTCADSWGDYFYLIITLEFTI